MKKKKKKYIWFHHLACTTLWFSKGWGKAPNHSCPIYPGGSGISDVLVGSNFSQDHDLLLEVKRCWFHWGHLQWEMKLIWHFVGFVLAAVCRKSLCLIKDWKNRPGKSRQVFCVRDKPKVRMKIKMPIQVKAIRWVGRVWGEIFCSDGVTGTLHFRIAIRQKCPVKHNLTS